MTGYMKWIKRVGVAVTLLAAGAYPNFCAGAQRGGHGGSGQGGGRGATGNSSSAGRSAPSSRGETRASGEISSGRSGSGSSQSSMRSSTRDSAVTGRDSMGTRSSAEVRATDRTARTDSRRSTGRDGSADRNWRGDHDHHDGHHHHDNGFVFIGFPWFGYSPFYSYGYGWGNPYYYGYDPYFAYDGYGVVAEQGYVRSENYDRVDTGGAASSRRGGDSDGFARRGEAAFRNGDYREAAREWRHALVDDPRNGTLVMMLAQALFATGQYDEAAGAVQRAMAIMPQDRWGTVVANYRDLYGNTQDYVEQLKDLEQAVREQPKNPALRFLVAFHYGHLGYPRDAVRELDQATKLAPDDRIAAELRDVMGDRTTRR